MLFDAPHAIDVRATVEVATPAQWKAALPDQQNVPVLRLCEGKGPKMPGWCAVAGDLQGAEFETMCGGINTKHPTHGGIWRQGNLLHFGFEPSPSEYNETGRRLLLNGIAYIARFLTDRPITREKSFLDPGPSASKYWFEFMLTSPKAKVEDIAGWLAEPWRGQLAALDIAEARAFAQERMRALRVEGSKFTFDQDALDLGVDVQKSGVVRQLADLLRGEQVNRARRLLVRLLPDGPGAAATTANWHNWLEPREDALCFDVHARIWRLDLLAHARGAKSDDLRGPARADGDATRDPAAAELAAKIVAHYGGARALDDLKTFTCWLGDIRCCWDRQRGLFRLENTGTIPDGNRGTEWKVVIFDTAADVDLLRGGGPEPRPFVSGRGYFRELQERLFLPLLLLEPGTTLRLLPDADGKRCLEVRLAGRCADPRKVHVLHVHAESGALSLIDVISREGGRKVRLQVELASEVGPLRLPSRFVCKKPVGSFTVDYEHAKWNPPLPAGIDASKEMLLGGR
ncbi:MAG TPA: hypothetical protein VFT55_06290 [Planctomycetota bacterium]|nr:hypothetical protein [Planctomycetota bacterium]